MLKTAWLKYVLRGQLLFFFLTSHFLNNNFLSFFLSFFGHAGSSVDAQAFLQLQRAGDSCSTRVSHRGGFSCCRPCALKCMGFSSCSTVGSVAVAPGP